MNLEEIKALGAPFHAAEVQISVRQKINRLVLIVREPDGRYRTSDNPAMDFPWHDECDDPQELGLSVLAAANNLGLLSGQAETHVIDLDKLAEGAS